MYVRLLLLPPAGIVMSLPSVMSVGGVGRAAARLQGFVQGFVGGDAGSTAAYHHFIRNLRLRVPAGDVAAGEFHLGVSRAGVFL